MITRAINEIAIQASGATTVINALSTQFIYRITGTVTITGDNNITATDQASGASVFFIYDAVVTYSGAKVNILGYDLTTDQALKNWIVVGVYDGSVWDVKLIPNFTQSGIIEGSELANNSVATINIQDDAVTTAKIDDDAVTTVKIADNAVTTAKILDANVTAAKLASDAVTTVKILDANVTAAKILNDAVTTVKILDANVTEAKLAANSVSNSKIADSAVTLLKLADTNRLISASSLSGVANSGLVEEVLLEGSFTNQLTTNGDFIVIKAMGVCAANVDAKSIRLRIGGLTGTQIAINSITASPNGLSWEIEALIERIDATNGQVTASVEFNGVASQKIRTTISGANSTWANALTISLTGLGTSVGDITAFGLYASLSR